MKYIAKLMLAALASISLVGLSYAADFAASGSVSADWLQQTVAPADGDATTTMNFSGSSGGITLSYGNLSYAIDYDGDGGGMDETISLSGSTKKGAWTVSGTASQSKQENGSGGTSDDSAAITMTDGSITYVLGNASHLGGASQATSGTADGAQGADANVGGFDGFSVGMGLAGGTFTFALQMVSSADNSTLMGEGGVSPNCAHQNTSFGINYTGSGVSFTYATGSAALGASCVGDEAGSANTMGLSYAGTAGDIGYAFDYHADVVAYTATGGSEGGTATSGFELSVTMGGIADGTAGLNVSSTSTVTTTGGEAGDPATKAGTELWWGTNVGAATLDLGYGSAAVAEGSTTTQIKAAMGYSF